MKSSNDENFNSKLSEEDKVFILEMIQQVSSQSSQSRESKTTKYVIIYIAFVNLCLSVVYGILTLQGREIPFHLGELVVGITMTLLYTVKPEKIG
jgi:Na+/glutamate symporter